jgi:hypothetical protein
MVESLNSINDNKTVCSETTEIKKVLKPAEKVEPKRSAADDLK